ncbi:MAG: hypothetical protein QM479_16085 [Pseudomonadota bacterium]
MDENLIFALLQIASGESDKIVNKFHIKGLLDGGWVKYVTTAHNANYYTITQKAVEYLENVERNLLWWENPEIVDWKRFQQENKVAI